MADTGENPAKIHERDVGLISSDVDAPKAESQESSLTKSKSLQKQIKMMEIEEEPVRFQQHVVTYEFDSAKARRQAEHCPYVLSSRSTSDDRLQGLSVQKEIQADQSSDGDTNQAPENAAFLSIQAADKSHEASKNSDEASDKSDEAAVQLPDSSERELMNLSFSSLVWTLNSSSESSNEPSDVLPVSSDAVCTQHADTNLQDTYMRPVTDKGDHCSPNVPHDLNQSDRVPSPIVCAQWQFCDTIDNSGKMLRKPSSDVILHIPPGAIQSGSTVVVRTAVCVDTERVRRVLTLPEDEMIVSPLAEYWAGPDFSFQCPVRITLPHFLSQDSDLDMLNVYRINRDLNGDDVLITRVRRDQQEDAGVHFNCGKDGISFVDSDEKQKPSSDENDFSQNKTEIKGTKDRYGWEESGYFQVSSDGQVFVITQHFCAYVCSYCHLFQHLPPLLIVVYGADTTYQLSREADIDLIIWDKRIDIADFREEEDDVFINIGELFLVVAVPKEYRLGAKLSEVDRRPMLLLDDLQNTKSKIHLKLTVLGVGAQHWQHQQASDGNLGGSVVQTFGLENILSCKDKNCTSRETAAPLFVQWRLMTRPDFAHLLRIVISVAHVTSSKSPSWRDRDKIEIVTQLNLSMTQTSRITQTCSVASQTEKTLEELTQNRSITETQEPAGSATAGLSEGAVAHNNFMNDLDAVSRHKAALGEQPSIVVNNYNITTTKINNNVNEVNGMSIGTNYHSNTNSAEDCIGAQAISPPEHVAELDYRDSESADIRHVVTQV